MYVWFQISVSIGYYSLNNSLYITAKGSIHISEYTHTVELNFEHFSSVPQQSYNSGILAYDCEVCK